MTPARTRHTLACLAQQPATGRGQPGMAADLELSSGIAKPRQRLAPFVSQGRRCDQPPSEVVPPGSPRTQILSALLGESRRLRCVPGTAFKHRLGVGEVAPVPSDGRASGPRLLDCETAVPAADRL